MTKAKQYIINSTYQCMSEKTLSHLITEYMQRLEELSASDYITKAKVKNLGDRLDTIRAILKQKRTSV